MIGFDSGCDVGYTYNTYIVYRRIDLRHAPTYLVSSNSSTRTYTHVEPPETYNNRRVSTTLCVRPFIKCEKKKKKLGKVYKYKQFVFAGVFLLPPLDRSSLCLCRYFVPFSVFFFFFSSFISYGVISSSLNVSDGTGTTYLNCHFSLNSLHLWRRRVHVASGKEEDQKPSPSSPSLRYVIPIGIRIEGKTYLY